MQRRGNCVANSPGVIETGPLLYRHWCVSNESIRLTAQHPRGPPVHDYQCITDEYSWIESAICQCIWLNVCQTRVQGNSRANATCVCCFGKLKRVRVTCPNLSHFLYILLHVDCVGVFVWQHSRIVGYESIHAHHHQNINDLLCIYLKSMCSILRFQ